MSDLPPLDLIEVTAHAHEWLRADEASVKFTLEGTSFFVAGSAALQQAQELRDVTQKLVALGVAETDVSLLEIESLAGEGFLGKGGRARYTVSVLLKDLARLGEVVQVVTQNKSAQLKDVDWRFTQLADAEARVTALAAGRARVKATLVAQALGMPLGRLHRLIEEGVNGGYQPDPSPPRVRSAPLGAPAGAGGPPPLSLSAVHWRQVRRNVSALFHAGASPEPK